MRDDRIPIRLTPDARTACETAAKSVGLDLASWLRMRALEAARGRRKIGGKLAASTAGPPILIRFETDDADTVRDAAAAAKVDVGEFIRRAAAK